MSDDSSSAISKSETFPVPKRQLKIAAVKFAFIATALAVAILLPCAGQQTSDAPTSSNKEFHWNPDDSQELDVKDTIARIKGLAQAERNALIGAIAIQLQHDFGEQGDSKQQWRLIAAQTQIKLVDLNGDGVPEVVAQGVGDGTGCSATGNCPFWIFRRVGSGYQVLLDASEVQTFTIQPTQTNGFRDFVLGTHGSAFVEELHWYRFDNGSYRDTACYIANWRRLVGDDYQDLKNPDITPCDE